MNDSQDKKYWRRWSAVVRVNQWRWLDGRIVAEAVLDDHSEHHAAIWQIARDLAGKAHRAPVANDLRHACHVHALGRDVSHKKMTDAQFNRLLILWGNERNLGGLLVEPDLNSQMAWTNPDEAERKSAVEYVLQLAPEAIIISIAKNRFTTANWRFLNREQLLALGRIIRDRNSRPHVPREADIPF